MNDFDITDIEAKFSDAIRTMGVSRNVWNNRPKATADSISEFVVVKVSGGVSDKCTYGECHIAVSLFARDIKEMKNSKKLSLMQKAMESLPTWIDPLLIRGNPRIIGDTADDFGFHVRIMNFKLTIKAA